MSTEKKQLAKLQTLLEQRKFKQFLKTANFLLEKAVLTDQELDTIVIQAKISVFDIPLGSL